MPKENCRSHAPSDRKYKSFYSIGALVTEQLNHRSDLIPRGEPMMQHYGATYGQ